MDWGQIGQTPDLPTWRAKFHYYRTHHPIIMGMAFLCCMSGSFMAYMFATKIDKHSHIKKYKDTYLVYRPDDPHVALIRKGPIGLDNYRYK